MAKKISVTSSSGNVFADLGFDNPEEELLIAQQLRENCKISNEQSVVEAADEDDHIFPPEYRAAQQAQARQLKDQASQGGLNFEAYLTPREADWVLAAVENGDFLDPSELVWVAVQQFIEMQAHPDLRRELLKRQLQKSMDDPRPGIPIEEAFAQLEAEMKESERHEAARWEKVGREFLPADPDDTAG